jgi:predicted DNA-binding protein with PD1-like motif
VRSRELDISRAFFLVFDRGDEVLAKLRAFAQENRIAGGHFTAIGGFDRVRFAWWSWETKEYEERELEEQLEVVSLIGDIALEDGHTKLHAHVTLGRRDGICAGGHLIRGYVRPTLEMQLFDYGSSLTRKRDEETKLSLLEI